MPTITTGSTVSLIPGNAKRKSLVVANTDTVNAVGGRFFNKNTTVPTSSDYDLYWGPGIEKSFNLFEDSAQVVTSPLLLIAIAGTPKVVWEDSEQQ